MSLAFSRCSLPTNSAASSTFTIGGWLRLFRVKSAGGIHGVSSFIGINGKTGKVNADPAVLRT
jgi:hypothetical protein